MILSADAYCRTCGYQQRGNCIRWGRTVDITKDFCSEHRRALLLCGVCGQPVLTKSTMLYPEDNGEIKVICTNCYNTIKMKGSQV